MMGSLARLALCSCASALEIEGDLAAWDSIFASRTPRHLVAADLSSSDFLGRNMTWPEGPLVKKEYLDHGRIDLKLLFSDTVEDVIWSYDLHSNNLQILRDKSGDCPENDLEWKAEPGSNGLAQWKHSTLVCQHGARRLVLLGPDGSLDVVASEFKGKALNSPNDVVVRSEDGRDYAFFTDPVYGWLEKSRFEDLPYLDEAVASKGPGHCGVYKVELGATIGEVELVATMDRPNGLAFRGDSLIVSDCCQGNAKRSCMGGTSRWKVFEKQGGQWQAVKTVEDVTTQEPAPPGCSDGFKVDEITGLIVSSCAGGVCIVDVDAGKVLARMKTTDGDGGWRVSNMVFEEQTGALYMTTETGIWELALNSNRGKLRKEL